MALASPGTEVPADCDTERTTSRSRATKSELVSGPASLEPARSQMPQLEAPDRASATTPLSTPPVKFARFSRRLRCRHRVAVMTAIRPTTPRLARSGNDHSCVVDVHIDLPTRWLT